MFYEFDQNNSGGRFEINDEVGIGSQIWVEATDPVCAISIALQLGIYFDGVAKGMDCGCCGDRWREPWGDDGKAAPDISRNWDFKWHDTVYVHRLNGSVEKVHLADLPEEGVE